MFWKKAFQNKKKYIISARKVGNRDDGKISSGKQKKKVFDYIRTYYLKSEKI